MVTSTKKSSILIKSLNELKITLKGYYTPVSQEQGFPGWP